MAFLERIPSSAFGLVAGCLLVACGGSSSSPGSGGEMGSSSGGTSASGGMTASGGSSASGGSNATGGSPSSSGGATSTGGRAQSGGTTGSTGGVVGGSGGAPATGGAAGRASAGASGTGTGGAAGGNGNGNGNGGAPPSGGEPPSCAAGGPGLDTCGADGHESCCASLLVMGGMFSRTYTNSGSGATGKADPATISSFRLDKYELTVGRFRQYVNYLVAGGMPPAAGSGKHTHLNGGMGLADSSKSGSFEPGWDSSWSSNIPTGAGAAATWTKNLAPTTYGTWTMTAGNNEMLPLTFLNWYEAHAFCIWDGGFLPSEAEWKYAAAGGDEQREYPWGSADPGTDSKFAIFDCYYPNKTKGNCTSTINVAKVGSTPMGIGRWGQFDLSGSVWEWNLDVYGTYVSPCTDCARFSGGTQRVLPGGGFHTPLTPDLLSSNRMSVSYATTYRGDYGVGVRCARVP